MRFIAIRLTGIAFFVPILCGRSSEVIFKITGKDGNIGKPELKGDVGNTFLAVNKQRGGFFQPHAKNKLERRFAYQCVENTVEMELGKMRDFRQFIQCK